MPRVYLLILSVLENFERRFITCFWFVGSCLHVFLFIYLFIIPPGDEFYPVDVPSSSDVLHPDSCPADVPPSPDVSHSEFCPPTSHLLRMSYIRNYVRPMSHLLRMSYIWNSVRRHLTFSGCLTSGILSGRRSTFSGYFTSDTWRRMGEEGDSTSPVRHVRILW